MKSEQRYRDLIDEAFLGTISPRAWNELRAHLASCAPCRERYNRSARAERKLSGGSSASPQELARVEAAVFAALDAERPSFFDRLRASRPLLLGAAAVAAVLLAFVVAPFRDESGEELRARGAAATSRPASIHAFCLTAEGAVPLAPLASCKLSDQLKLSLENRGGYRYAFLVGVQEDRAPRWYAPRPPETESVVAPATAGGEVPFGGAVRLDVNHRAGALRIFGLFSDEPISSADVEAAIRAMAPGAERLPLRAEGVEQRTVSIEVAP